jgi:hypothetical protein
VPLKAPLAQPPLSSPLLVHGQANTASPPFPIPLLQLHLGDGTGPGLVKTYYEMVGWPMMLPSSERGAFVDKILSTKARMLQQMVQAGEVPLRDGVAEVIDDALADGARVVVLAATASSPEDSLVSSAMLNLGPRRAFQIHTLTVGGVVDEEAEEGAAGSRDEGDGEGGGTSLTFEQQVSSARANMKSTVARSFARVRRCMHCILL